MKAEIAILTLALTSLSAHAISVDKFYLSNKHGPVEIKSMTPFRPGSESYTYLTTDGDELQGVGDLMFQGPLTAVDSTQYLLKKTPSADRSTPDVVQIIRIRHALLNPSYRNALVGYDIVRVKNLSDGNRPSPLVIATNTLWNANNKIIDAKDIATAVAQASREGARVEVPLGTLVAMADEANKSFEFGPLEDLIRAAQSCPDYAQSSLAQVHAKALAAMISDTPYSEKTVDMLKNPQSTAQVPVVKSGFDTDDVIKEATKAVREK